MAGIAIVLVIGGLLALMLLDLCTAAQIRLHQRSLEELERLLAELDSRVR